MTNETASQNVTVSSGQTTTVRFGGIATQVCRMGEAILFDTARSFIKSDYKAAIEQAFAFGLTPAGSGKPGPRNDRFLLIVGHTDQVDSQAVNQALSIRRAQAGLAVFTLDEPSWEALFQRERWGSREIEMMSLQVDTNQDSTLIAHYLADTASRLDLMKRYLMFLRPAWLPQVSPAIHPAMVSQPNSPILGCNFQHPVQDKPGHAVAENRRIEFLYFQTANSGARGQDDCSAYATWRRLECNGQLITVHLEIRNEYNEPIENEFDLTLPTGGVLQSQRTDARGLWSRAGLPSGRYKLHVGGLEITELPSGSLSKIDFEFDQNATSKQVSVQVIDLNRWFIPKPNTTTTIPQFSRGNIVEPLIDGENMMREVHRACVSTRSSDHYIYLTDWGITATTHMLGATTSGADVLPTLIDAIGRNVEVRALLWDGTGTNNTFEQEQIDLDTRTPHRGQAILDNETLSPLGEFGSHHQKTTVVNGSDGVIAFCGGIDLTRGRWDSVGHAFPNPRREDFPNNPIPWHDVHTRIRGPAAGDIETNFRERWNNHPNHTANGRTIMATHSAPSSLPNGSHLVQTLRTFPPRMRYPFAPTGELGFFNAYRQVIANACDYIYIEDQYLAFDEIGLAIGAVLKRLRGKVIIVIPRRNVDDPGTAPDAFWFHRRDFIDHLTSIDASKIGIYHLRNHHAAQDIYVHAKLMIVDDIWAQIGSANVNRRSMTHDSEIGVAVIDGAVENGRRKYARDLRKRLWAEHLGVSTSTVDDPLSSIGLWAKMAAAKGGQIENYPNPRGSDSMFWNSKIDPDGR